MPILAILAAGIAIAAASPASGADFPTMPRHISSAGVSAPPGWKIVKNVSGDLNGDRSNDMVIVLKTTGGSNSKADRYLLAVYLARLGGDYELFDENHTLIPPNSTAGTFDGSYFDTQRMAIEKGILKVGLSRVGAGGVDVVFSFRMKHGQLALIAYDSLGYAHGGYLAGGIDYLRHKLIVNGGFITSASDPSSAAHNRAVSKKIPATRLLTLDDLGNGMDFDNKFRKVFIYPLASKVRPPKE